MYVNMQYQLVFWLYPPWWCIIYCIIAVVFMGHLGRLLMHFAKIWRILFMFILIYSNEENKRSRWDYDLDICIVFKKENFCSPCHDLVRLTWTQSCIINFPLAVCKYVLDTQVCIITENTHTFEEFDLIQGSLSVVRGALHHFQGAEPGWPEVETIQTSHFTFQMFFFFFLNTKGIKSEIFWTREHWQMIQV